MHVELAHNYIKSGLIIIKSHAEAQRRREFDKVFRIINYNDLI